MKQLPLIEYLNQSGVLRRNQVLHLQIGPANGMKMKHTFLSWHMHGILMKGEDGNPYTADVKQLWVEVLQKQDYYEMYAKKWEKICPGVSEALRKQDGKFWDELHQFEGWLRVSEFLPDIGMEVSVTDSEHNYGIGIYWGESGKERYNRNLCPGLINNWEVATTSMTKHFEPLLWTHIEMFDMAL